MDHQFVNINIKENNIWKKYIRYISLYTHPDKTSNEILHYFFEKSHKKYEKEKIYYLIFMLKILEIDNKIPIKYKHLKGYKSELNYHVMTFVKKRHYYTKAPVYSYDTMNDMQKEQLIKFCLSNNMVEFKKCTL